MNLNTKYFLFFLLKFLILLNFDVYAKDEKLNNLHKEISNQENFNNKLEGEIFQKPTYEISLKQDQFRKVFHDDFFILNQLITQALKSENLDEDNEKYLNLEADTQYQENNIFYAEGDAIIYFGNSILSADQLIYDRTKRNFIAKGNVFFIKGSQFFEASKFEYNFIDDNGYAEDVYGILDLKEFSDDFDLTLLENADEAKIIKKENLKDLRYIDSTKIGLENTFEPDKRFNITDFKVEIPQVTKWRFKSKKIIFSSEDLSSKDVLFTNDAYNKPQFQIYSKKFIGTKVKEKLKLVSKNTWIVLDQNFKFPIGRRTIFKRDRLSKWSLGSDYRDMDGLFIKRTFEEDELFNDYYLEISPYYFIQRSLKGTTEAFRDNDESILEKTSKRNNTFWDNFGLGVNVKRTSTEFDVNDNLINWDFSFRSLIYSLDPSKFSQAVRSKVSLTRSVDLTYTELDNAKFKNIFNYQLYASYRETVPKGFAGDEEIYFGKGFSLANRKVWNFDDYKELNLVYDIGQYKAEMKNEKSIDELFRNLFAVRFNYQFPVWTKKSLDRNISEDYKFSPVVIDQGVKWISNLNAGLFIYSDGSKQEAITISTGPEVTLGSFKGTFFNYSKLRLTADYIFKNGESAFRFDDIDETEKLQINFDQQLIGPLVFSYFTYLNLDSKDSNYGKFIKPKYSLNINRRAYSFGAFYDVSNESIGFQFNIFNFDYSGIPEKF